MFGQQGLMSLDRSPTYQRALSERLRHNAQRKNNGTIPGGLASMIDQGLAGYMQAVDNSNQRKAQEALIAGMTEATPVGEMGEDSVPAGIDGASQRLAAMKDNPYAGRLSQMLAVQRMADQRRQAELASNREYEAGLRREDRDWRTQMTQNNQAFQREMLERQQAAARANRRAPAPPPAIQQYEYARNNGYQGSFMDFQLALGKSRSQNINVNTGQPQRAFPGLADLPKGYDLVRDSAGNPVVGPDGNIQMLPIRGGPAETKAEKLAEVKQNARNIRQQTADIIGGKVNEARNLIGSSAIPITGGFSVLAGIPGTEAHNLGEILDTIRSNVGFDKLQALRDASPQGGALGQVTEREHRLLQSAIASLAQSQSEEQLLQNLAQVEAIYNRIIHGPTGGREGDIGNGITAVPPQQDFSKMSDEQLRRIANGQ